MCIEPYIKCQPAFIQSMLDTRDQLVLPIARELRENSIKQLILLGCGSSFHAALTCSWIFRREVCLPCEAISSYSFIEHYPSNLLNTATAVIGISQQGMSAKTDEALRKAKTAGAITVSITADPESKLVQTADFTVLFDALDEKVGPKTKGYTGSVVCGALLAILYKALIKNEKDESEVILGVLPAQLQKNLDKEVRGSVLENIEKIIRSEYVVYAGIGPDLGSAEEGALKLVEMAKMPAFAYETEELMHGRFEGIRGKQACMVILFPNNPNGRNRSQDLVEVAQKAEVNYVILDPCKNSPELMSASDYVLSLINIHLCQMIACYTADKLQIDPTVPKGPRLQYLTKLSNLRQGGK